MRDIRNMALASLAAFALLIPSVDIDAQVRRTTTTTNQQRTGTGSTQQRSFVCYEKNFIRCYISFCSNHCERLVKFYRP